MNKRKAFTLVELLVVIGIIAVLVGLLLPVLSHVQRQMKITGEKAEFQAIESALVNYHQTFADYPRNSKLPTWNVMANNINAPQYFTLAAALMGPGPMVSNYAGGLAAGGPLQAGDGADGPGFRTQSITAPGVASGAGTTYTVNITNPAAEAALVGYTTTTILNANITFDPANPNQHEETAGIIKLSGTSGIYTITTTPTVWGHSPIPAGAINCVVHIPTGKVWPSFLPADQFHVAYVPMNDDTLQKNPFDSTTGLGGYGIPVLLDHFGQVIQYFPRYGKATNRTIDSGFLTAAGSSLTTSSVLVGPLVGDCQPKSADSGYGWNALFDPRDGTPFYDNNQIGANPTTTGPGARWPVTTTPNSYNPITYSLNLAVMWMLGDDTATQNLIPAGSTSKLRFDGDYILISAGPDGPFRANGGYCNFAPLNSLGVPILATSDQFQKLFLASGNIYSFDR